VKTRAPDAIGIDYIIGESKYIGRGLGTRAIFEYCRDHVRTRFPDATRVLASPDHRNHASTRALSKAGFTAGDWIDVPTGDGRVDTEVVCTLDLTRMFG
jgi:aminoglycoside 6'-N-acetyltransferase